jgi:hypothetical protein
LNNVKNHGISKSGGGSRSGFSIRNFEKQHRATQGHILNCEACVLLLPRLLKPCFYTRHIRSFVAQPANVNDVPPDTRALPSDPSLRIQQLVELHLLAEFATNAHRKMVTCSVCLPSSSYDLMSSNIIGALRRHRESRDHVDALLQRKQGQTTLFGSSAMIPPSSSSSSSSRRQ